MIIVQLDMVNSTEIVKNLHYQIGHTGLKTFFISEIKKYVTTALETLPNIKPQFENNTGDGYILVFQNDEAEFVYDFVKKFCELIDQRNSPDTRSWWFRVGAAKDDQININDIKLRVGMGFQRVKELETAAIPGWFFVDNSTHRCFPNDIQNKFSQKDYKHKSNQMKRAWACQMMFSDDLNSDHNIDYTTLQLFLKAGDWQKADLETSEVMRQIWLAHNKNGFSCTDLCTIDRLWVKYSSGRFGFSVQKRIWESVNRDYEKFGNRVGWKKSWWNNIGEITDWWSNKGWITNNDVILNTEAPAGHLPLGHVNVSINNYWTWLGGQSYRINGNGAESGVAIYGYFLSTLSNCNL
jgi:hypothetical protein